MVPELKMAQGLGDRKNILAVADLFEDAGIEPFGEKQNTLLLARRTKQAAFAGVGEDFGGKFYSKKDGALGLTAGAEIPGAAGETGLPEKTKSTHG